MNRICAPPFVLGAVLSVVTLLGIALPSMAQPLPAQFRGGPAHTGVTETPGLERLGGLAWRFETGGPVRSSPTVAAGVVYFGSTDGALHAVDAATGAELWRHETGSPVGGAPLVTDKLVVFADRDLRIHAVDRATGLGVWTVETGEDLPLRWGYEGWDYLLSSPTLATDASRQTVLVGSGDGHLYALDPATGEVLWRFRTGGRIRSAPAVYDGVAYVGSGDGVVYGISLAEGREVWRFETAGTELDAADFGFDRTQIQSSPAVADGVLYIGSRDASLYAVDLATRTARWTLEDGTAWVVASPAVRGDRVFSARSSSGKVRAVDAVTGKELWAVATGGLVFSSPVVVGDTVYVASGSGWVFALDAGDGSERWRYPLEESSVSTPAVWEGRLYVGSDDGHLYALEAARGPAPRLAVYWDDALMDRSALGAKEEHRRILDHFRELGYEVLDGEALTAFLEERVEDRIPSVVVFAMDGTPAGVMETDPGAPARTPLFRRYLDSGGKVVWLGYSPRLLLRDPDTGKVTGVDRTRPTDLLGVDHSAWNGDRYGATLTPAGRRWGLETAWVGNPTVAASEDVTPLALDELGRAVAWVKRYGGKPGTGFLQLAPTTDSHRLEEIRRAAEYGVFREPLTVAPKTPR
jgi:outer membrane protein assembly factor BamB